MMQRRKETKNGKRRENLEDAIALSVAAAKATVAVVVE
jgi:hypothetical protein